MKARTTKATRPVPRTIPKAAPKVCRGGHRQNSKWREGDDCWQCDQADKARALNDPAVAAAYRAEKLAELPPLPDTFVMAGVTYRARPPRRRR
jgi:hypothetical protein